MLDDAVYNRNRKIEQAMNFTLEEVKMPYAQWNTDQIALMDRVTNSVMAGDDEFDAAYVQPYFKPAILTEGSLVDLNSIPELKLDEIWWDRSLNSSFDINGKLYAATGALQFMPLDSVSTRCSSSILTSWFAMESGLSTSSMNTRRSALSSTGTRASRGTNQAMLYTE